MSTAGRIIYNSINLDFIRPFLRFDIENVNRVDTLVASSGIKEDLEYYDIDMIRAISQTLTGNEVEQLLQFYNFAKDGSSFEVLRDRDLGIMIGFEGKSLNGSSEETGTFTRTNVNDGAYVVDPSTGLLTVNNTGNSARFPAGEFGSGFLIEGSSTNLITDPSDLGTNWVNVGAVNTIATNTTETDDALGTNIADKVTWGATPNPIRFTTSVTISTNDAVFSVLAKSGKSGNSGIILVILDSTGSQLATSGSLSVKPFDSTNNFGNGFQRFSVTFENGGTNANDWRVEISGTEGDVVYLMAFQLERGADVLFPSQPMGVTLAISAARNNEALSYTAANVVNNNNFTFSGWISPEWIFDKHADAYLFSVDSGGSSELLVLFVNTAGVFTVRYNRFNTSTAGASIDQSASGLTQNTFSHIALTGDSTISNGLNLYLDGALIATSSNSAFSPSTLGTNLDIGVQDDGTSHAFAVFDDFFIRKDVLDASKIKQIFNAGRGVGERRNRFATMELVNRSFNPVRRIGTNRYSFQLLAREVIS